MPATRDSSYFARKPPTATGLHPHLNRGFRDHGSCEDRVPRMAPCHNSSWTGRPLGDSNRAMVELELAIHRGSNGTQHSRSFQRTDLRG